MRGPRRKAPDPADPAFEDWLKKTLFPDQTEDGPRTWDARGVTLVHRVVEDALVDRVPRKVVPSAWDYFSQYCDQPRGEVAVAAMSELEEVAHSVEGAKGFRLAFQMFAALNGVDRTPRSVAGRLGAQMRRANFARDNRRLQEAAEVIWKQMPQLRDSLTKTAEAIYEICTRDTSGDPLPHELRLLKNVRNDVVDLLPPIDELVSKHQPRRANARTVTSGSINAVQNDIPKVSFVNRFRKRLRPSTSRHRRKI